MTGVHAIHLSNTTYVYVRLGLLVLTVATYLAAKVDLGKLNIVLAFAIATVKRRAGDAVFHARSL